MKRLIADNIKISNTSVLDTYQGELFCQKYAYDNASLIGLVDLSIFDETIYIQNIEVTKSYQRKGIATKLIDSLFEEFPNKVIKLSLMTDDGYEFFSNKYNIDENNYITRR